MSAISKSTAAEGQWMGDRTELKAYVLRNELAIIIGCQDGRSAEEKAEAVIRWMDRNDGRATIQPTAAEPVAAVIDKGASWADATLNKYGLSLPSGTKLYAAPVAPADAVRDAPIKMILHCPQCHTQHIDAPDKRTEGWTNPPHRSHLCHHCNHIWRPADVATEGVAAIETRGEHDHTPKEPAK